MIRINWMEGYGNTPTINIEDESLTLNPRSKCEFTEQVSGLWYHVQDNGLVQYFAHDGSENNNGGFGGAVFEVLVNGEKRRFPGPWSSRATCFNTGRQDAFVDVLVNGSPCAILLSELLKRWDQPFYLVEAGKSGPGWFLGERASINPSTSPDGVVKPSGMVCTFHGHREGFSVHAEPVLSNA